MRPLPSSAPARYGLVLPILLAVVALQYLALPRPDLAPFPLPLAGVALAAWLGGLGPGLLCVALSALLADYAFVAPAGAFSSTPAALRASAVYVVVALGVAALCAGFRSAVARTTRASEDLRRSERLAARAGRLSEQIPVVVRDAAGRILSWNRGCERLYGWRAEEALGRTTETLLRAEYPRPIEEILASLRRAGEWQGELRHVRADGEPLALAVTWLLDRDGEEEVIVEYLTDLTGLRRAEAERLRLAGQVEEEQQVLRTLLATLPVGVFLFDAQGALLISNVEAERIWGGVVPAASVSDYRQYRAWSRATGRLVEPDEWPASRALQTERPVPPELYDIEAFDGTRRAALLAAVPLRGLEGRVKGAVAVVQDVTDLTAAERALRRSRELLADSQRIGHVGSFELELPGSQVTLTDEAYRILGLPQGAEGTPPRPLTIEDLWDRIVDGDREQARLSLRQIIEGHGPAETRYRVRRPDGELRTILRRARVETNPRTGDRRLIGIIQDVTEQAELEQRIARAEKLESLSVLAGGVAHDFNNLLTGILGHVELALFDAGDDPQLRAALASIRQSATRAAELAHQMLAYSGRAHVSVEPVDLNALLQDTVELARAGIPKGVTVTLALSRDLPVATVDPTQIRQVLLNLLVNAAEATGGRGGTVVVRSEAVRVDRGEEQAPDGTPLPPGRYVRLVVEDSGHGMDEATRRRVFEPFFSTKFPGRGLGMAAVQGIVRGHAGTIHIDSRPGEGTTVCVLLPVKGHALAAEAAATGAAVADAARADAARADAARSDTARSDAARTTSLRGAAAPAGGAGAADALALGRPCVLVVDDEEPVRSATRKYLERKGFRVITAVDGEEGLRLLRANGVEVRAVLLDATMPRMGVVDVLREIRTVRPDVPVLVTSGYSEDDVLSRVGAERGRIAGFVHKPVDFRDLERRLVGLCDRRRPPRPPDH